MASQRDAGRRADLTVRRLATGLEKNETAALLGVEKKHYYTWERGKPPSLGLLAELQAVDDFITASASQLEVTDVDGVSVVLMLDDQRQFEHSYPQARTARRRPIADPGAPRRRRAPRPPTRGRVVANRRQRRLT
ncbi:MAG: hypothetical protein JOZ49_21940 [Mycolicibacterium sp.]|nr:hypothetical protein [Mycolicibacterium sp.]